MTAAPFGSSYDYMYEAVMNIPGAEEESFLPPFSHPHTYPTPTLHTYRGYPLSLCLIIAPNLQPPTAARHPH